MGQHYDWMHEMMWGMGFGPIGLILILLIIVLLVFAVFRQGGRPDASDRAQRVERDVETPLDILKKRYATGEISREEFEQMKKDILS